MRMTLEAVLFEQEYHSRLQSPSFLGHVVGKRGGSPLVGYKLSQVALGTRMCEYLIIVVILQRVLARMSYIVAETSFRMLEVLSFSSIGRRLDLLQ